MVEDDDSTNRASGHSGQAAEHDSEQERFWAGEFGDAYLARNQGPAQVAAKTALFSDVLRRTHGVESALELGANAGLNLEVIRRLRPDCRCTGVEINPNAFARLSQVPGVQAVHASILDVDAAALGKSDLCFTAGVLIHISPERLGHVYGLLHAASCRYVAVIEYYDPQPTEVRYRGHDRKLFKRDFAGEMLDRYPDLALLDYGFFYHRDPNFGGDDLNWFLMEKR